MTPMRFKGPAAYVADLDRSRAFYEGLLGLTVLKRLCLAEVQRMVKGETARA